MRTNAALQLSRVAGFVFLVSGAAKVAGHSAVVNRFRHWNYPKWLRIAIGAYEIQAAILLLCPKHRRAGAVALLAVMAGAIYTHAKTPGERLLIPIPLSTAAGLAVLGFQTD